MIDYTYLDVKEELRTAILAELLLRNIKDIKVVKADPVEAGHIPCIAINRADDSEDSQSISDQAGDEQLENGTWVDYKGTFFHETLEIRIWHFNADERDKLYVLVKTILFNVRAFLVEKGIINTRLRGGRDEQDTSLLPKPVYWAAINMDYLNPLEIAIPLDDNNVIADVQSVLTVISNQ